MTNTTAQESKGLTADDWQKAVFVQGACNLSGVVHAFSEVLPRIRESVGGETGRVNKHPISVMYASKIESLSQCDSFSNFSDAYEACKVNGERCQAVAL